jgi:lysophospholipase L1-like esterase
MATLKTRMATWAIYVVGCGVFCFAALEIALRIYMQVPVFSLRDWRSLEVQVFQTSGAVYDPLLGWTQGSDIVGGGFETISYGIRKNSDADEEPTSGGVLAVGDSFTAGSDVVNEDTWPAQLERMLRVRVLNAAVGGYSVDQDVLHVERLLPILKPRAVLVGIHQSDIQGVGYRTFNSPKPYFAQENGAWVRKNNPVPRVGERSSEPLYKRALVRSMVFHTILKRYTDYWYSGSGRGFERAANGDSIKGACYMLQYLKEVLAPQKIPAMIVLQYGGATFAEKRSRPVEVQALLSCARDLDVPVMDEYDHLAGLARTSLPDLKRYYIMAAAKVYGHMSPAGNAFIASLVAEKLRALVDLRTVAPLLEEQTAAGINRIPSAQPETFIRTAVELEPEQVSGPLANEPVYRITPSTSEGEHYLVLRWSAPQPGPVTFSTFVRSSAENDLIVQILDNEGARAIAHYSFRSGKFTPTAMGAAKAITHRAEAQPGGWLRISVSAELSGRKGTAIIQIAPRTPPSPGPAELVVQGMMVESGMEPTTYCRPRACAPSSKPQRS